MVPSGGLALKSSVVQMEKGGGRCRKECTFKEMSCWTLLPSVEDGLCLWRYPAAKAFQTHVPFHAPAPAFNFNWGKVCLPSSRDGNLGLEKWARSSVFINKSDYGTSVEYSASDSWMFAQQLNYFADRLAFFCPHIEVDRISCWESALDFCFIIVVFTATLVILFVFHQ